MQVKNKNKKNEGGAKARRGRPPKISRDDIVSASLRTKTDLTLKAVADDLRVTPQALYRYVSGIGDIMRMIVEKQQGKYPFPEDTGQNWFTFAYEIAHVLRRFYLAIPGLAEFAMNSPIQIPSVLAGYEKSITIARRTGFDDASAYWVTQAYIEFVYTWVAREQRRSAMAAASGKLGTTLLLERLQKPDADFPLLRAAIQMVENTSYEERFDMRLRWLLIGIAHEKGMKVVLPPNPQSTAEARKPEKMARKKR